MSRHAFNLNIKKKRKKNVGSRPTKRLLILLYRILLHLEEQINERVLLLCKPSLERTPRRAFFSRIKVGAEVKVGLAEMMIGSRSIEIATTVVLCTYY